MTVITEDTPAAGPEDLQWQIDQLTERLDRYAAELERERRCHSDTVRELTEADKRFDTLTERLTVGVLRKAGYFITIKRADAYGPCDTCGEEY
jgi:hypothetical protein